MKEERMNYTYEQIVKMIDHSLLHPTMTDEQLEHGCKLALACNVASVCIKPYYLRRCSEILRGSTVKSSTTIGFPHGGHTTTIKVAEARQALDEGCEELDMVVNIGKALSGDWKFVRSDIEAVLEVVHAQGKLMKVIFENCYLEKDHKIQLCKICAEAQTDYIKTSTGFGESGATIEDLKLMRQHSPSHVQIKASGGIRNLDQLLEIRALGVTRIGTSRTAEILAECERRLA